MPPGRRRAMPRPTATGRQPAAMATTNRQTMKSKEFFGKLLDRKLWLNLLAMALTVAALCLGVKLGLDRYTHHGEEIPVPDVRGMSFSEAKALIENDGLRASVSDTGYNKRMPADCVLLQNPAGGAKVKSGRMIYLTVNSESTPTLTIPDIADNSSVREAGARLKAMGFRLMPPELITGEKDWVYGIKARGRRVSMGDRVPIDVPLTLIVGSGTYDDSLIDVDYVDPAGITVTYGGEDDFEAVGEPPADEPAEATPGGGTGNTDTEQ